MDDNDHVETMKSVNKPTLNSITIIERHFIEQLSNFVVSLSSFSLWC